jgi:hypothetical protein
VLLLQGIGLAVLGAVVGSAVAAAVRQVGPGGGAAPGVPGLPPGLLPSGLPQLGTASDPCAPRPCLAHGGVTVLVGRVVRDAGPAPESGRHLVRLEVTFVGGSGSHEVATGELALKDSAGNLVLPAPAAGADCPGPGEAASLQAGQRLGPEAVCFSVPGVAGAPLSLVWVDPEDFSIVETRLP